MDKPKSDNSNISIEDDLSSLVEKMNINSNDEESANCKEPEKETLLNVIELDKYKLLK